VAYRSIESFCTLLQVKKQSTGNRNGGFATLLSVAQPEWLLSARFMYSFDTFKAPRRLAHGNSTGRCKSRNFLLLQLLQLQQLLLLLQVVHSTARTQIALEPLNSNKIFLNSLLQYRTQSHLGSCTTAPAGCMNTQVEKQLQKHGKHMSSSKNQLLHATVPVRPIAEQ
jgi:hypothetical protein